MKKWLGTIILFFLFAFKVNGQIATQTFIDKCTGETKIATIQYVNGNAIVSFYNQIRTFTPIEVQSGAMQTWLLSVYTTYANLSCATNPVVQQAVQQATQQASQQAASQAASSAASSAASAAASSSASSAASSSASSAASSSASSAAGSSASSTSSNPPTSSSGGSSSSSSSSSGSGGSSSTETKSEGGSSSSETKSESKSESSSESKSENKEESKSESGGEEKKEESKSEEKKEESKEEKKEEKKKQQNLNPLLLASDLTTAQSLDGRYSAIISMGVSRSSMAGDVSYGANAMVWSTLDQYAVSSNYTKMKFDEGKLNSIHSYGVTVGYLKGAWMFLKSYTYVKPDPKIGTYGFNVGAITLITKGSEGKRDANFSSSFVAFWTKPYQYSRKITLSPQVFVMSSPISYTPSSGYTNVSKNLGFLVGTSLDYKISKRFGFGINYKANINTTKGIPVLHNFLVGSRLIL
jgi:hypothetical protein